MRIDQMLTNLANQAGLKSLDLKVGQVVKATILQIINDQEAIIQIQGSKMKAQLAVPFSPGQSAWLQVQPESSDRQLVLKPLLSAPAAEQTIDIHALLNELGLKTSKDNQLLVQTMLQEKIPVTREQVQRFIDVLKDKPNDVKTEAWLKASVLAVQKNYPLTKPFVQALYAAAQEEPLHETLGQLQQQVKQVLKDQQLNQSGQLQQSSPGRAASAQIPPQTVQLLQQLAIALADIESIAAGAVKTVSAPAAAPVPANGSMKETPNELTQSSPASLPQQGAVLPDEAGAGRSAQNQLQSSSLSISGQAASEQQAELEQASQPEPKAAGDTPAQVNGLRSADQQSAQKLAGWIPQLLKELGLDHENQLKMLPQDRPQQQLLTVAVHSDKQQDADSRSTQMSSVKSILLQLSQAEGLPKAIQQSVQQAIQNLTGQQLLLQSNDQGVFSNVTLMLPIFQGNHAQTAAIHVQSRKKGRNGLDAENCNLLFDLNMQHLGSTLIDVQIFDRNVQIKIHNNHPSVPAVAESIRENLQPILQNMQYRLLSCAHAVLPEASAAPNSGKQADNLAAPVRPAASSTYKGVDMRI